MRPQDLTLAPRHYKELDGQDPRQEQRHHLEEQRIAQVINLASGIAVGSRAARVRDTPGRVYEYFLAPFAGAECKSGVQV